MVARMIRLGPDLELPIDSATEVFGALGQRKGGKTYGTGVYVEGLLDAGVQTVILDQAGKFYGLRLSADGKKPSGYKIVVLGGLRGDRPLTPEVGAVVADLVVDSGWSFIIDLSLFSKGQRARFCAEFGERLWLRKKQQLNPTVLHIVCEEAQLLLPQRLGPEDARMYGVWEEIVRLGRNFGIGITLISQRPQSINKEALTQVEILIVFKTNGLPERKALRDWIVDKDGDANLVEELPGLKRGEAFLWHPSAEVFKRVLIGLKRTFDSSATPKVGEHRPQAELKPINLEEFDERMKAVVTQAEKNDPTALKRRVAQLEQELAKTQAGKGKAAAPVPAKLLITDAQVKRVETLMDRAERLVAGVTAKADPLVAALKEVQAAAKELHGRVAGLFHQPNTLSRAPVERMDGPALALAAVARASKRQETPAAATDVTGDVTAPMQRILNTLADFEVLGRAQMPRSPVAVFSYASPRSSAFTNNLGRLRTMGLIAYPGSDQVQLTDAGRAAAATGMGEMLTDEALHRAWEKMLPAPQWAILRALLDKHPEAVYRDDLAGLAGASATSSAFTNNLGSLRTLGLIDYRPGRLVVATGLLFIESKD